MLHASRLTLLVSLVLLLVSAPALPQCIEEEDPIYLEVPTCERGDFG